nr:hypothetical protein [Gemmatimonadota bacterium]
RERGVKAGLLRIVAFRPFPVVEVRTLLSGRAKVAVLDRNMSAGHSGVFAEEIRSVLAGLEGSPPVFGYVVGLGGRDVRVENVLEIFDDLHEREEPELALFAGVKGLPIGPVRPDSRIIKPAEVRR